jgi:hypothetical protein
MQKKPTKNDIQALVDAGFTVADIALYNKWSVSKVRYWLKKYGLKATKEKGSIGAKAFKVFLQHTFPAFPIEEEYHIGNRLRLDFYIPGLYTAFEVDGSPHDETVGLFHGGEDGFEEAKSRDKMKDKWCEENNILLIRVTAKHAVTVTLDPKTRSELADKIRDKIAETKPTGPKIVEEKSPADDRYNEYRDRMNRLGREARRKSYRKAKVLKDKLKREHEGRALMED